MQLQTLSILNFKNIEEAELNFSPKINCFLGNNGMGKTNLLDAVYYLSFCKSHFNSVDSQNIKYDADFFMLKGKYEVNGAEEEISCGIKRRQKKHFKRNKKEYERLSDHIGMLPLVMISPDDAELIQGGSDERRKFIDGAISQYNKLYLNNLLNYNNILQQRNFLLKKDDKIDESLFDVLDEQLCEFGDYIFHQRDDFIEEFTPIFQQFYGAISGGNEYISLEYKSQHANGELITRMKEARMRDKILGFSTLGVHKDELEMTLESYPIKRAGSQGQCKTFAVSLRLAQMVFLKKNYGFAPVLLLDDIFDKLDAQRVERIIELVAGNDFGQIFITDTNRKYLDEILSRINHDSAIFMVENGKISKQEH